METSLLAGNDVRILQRRPAPRTCMSYAGILAVFWLRHTFSIEMTLA